MKKIILICLLLLPAWVYPQMTAKYKGIQINESIKADFDSLLKRLPYYLKLHSDHCTGYDQPNGNLVVELQSEETEAIVIYCLLTDSSFINGRVFDYDDYLWHFNDLINMVLFARKPGTLMGYVDHIAFYFFNAKGEKMIIGAAENWLYVDLSTTERPFALVPFKWQFGRILINIDFAKTNFSLVNKQKISNFFSYPFKTRQTILKQTLLYSENDQRSKILTILPANYSIKLLSLYQNWFKIKCGFKNQELIGWIRKVDLGY